MSATDTATSLRALPKNLITGAAAGVVAGIPLGIIMQVRDADPKMMPGVKMIDQVGDLISNPSTGLGWLIHLFNSALFGVVFVLLFSHWLTRRGPAMLLGLLYGVAWWVVGALWIMAAWLGMDELVFKVGANQWWSLVGAPDLRAAPRGRLPDGPSGAVQEVAREKRVMAELYERYCLVEGLATLDQQSPPWAPGRREEGADVERAAMRGDDIWCMAEVDIFADLTEAEMAAIAAAAPMKNYSSGDLLYSPHQPVEALFILKNGRVRIFRVSPDGQALTTALVTPGTVFGDMMLLGQQMHDNFAEALDEVVVCVMSRADVTHVLLSDPRIAVRIAEILGRRVAELERRLTDTVFKTAPQRVAATLCLLAGEQQKRPLSRGVQLALTHEQIAALTGTSRETVTKVLDEYAERGLLRLGRGKVTILDPAGMTAEAGD